MKSCSCEYKRFSQQRTWFPVRIERDETVSSQHGETDRADSARLRLSRFRTIFDSRVVEPEFVVTNNRSAGGKQLRQVEGSALDGRRANERLPIGNMLPHLQIA